MWEEKDWSDLPVELLHLISQKLPKLSDYVRFCAVCKIWCFSAPLSDHPPQLPWIVKHEASHYPISVVGDELQFYSIFSGETGIMCKNLSCTHRGKSFTGPSHGCLFLTDGYSKCVLFNPLTNKDMISLPSLRRPTMVWPWPVWTGTNPIPNRDIIVVDREIDRNNAKGSWFFYDRDNGKWIASESGYFYSCCYFGGKLFSNKGDYFTEVFDVSSRNILCRIAPPRDEQPPFRLPVRSYLVESAGEILRVSLNYESFARPKKTVFSIHKLAKFDGRNDNFHVYSWVKVSSIGDQMLFLDNRNGFSMSCRPFAGHKGNCIYFFFSNFTPCRYNIEDGSVEVLLPYPPFPLFTWFVPDLR